MRLMGPLLISVVLVAGCAGLPPKSENVRVLLERSGKSQPKLSTYDLGKRHLAANNAGLAVDAFQAALKDDPLSISALNGLAIAYDRLGRADVAQRFFDRALALAPESVVTLSNVGYLNLVQGNTVIAQAYAERAKIAASLPMDLMLAEQILGAVSRNAEIADQLARNEAQDRASAEIPNLPPESDVKRLGLNEWEVRVRPPGPGRAVRINAPVLDFLPVAQDPTTLPVSIPEPVMDLLMGSEVVLSEPLAAVPVIGAREPEPSLAALETPPLPAQPMMRIDPVSAYAPSLSLPAADEPVAAQPASTVPESVVASLLVPSAPAVSAVLATAITSSVPALPVSESEIASLAPMESRASVASAWVAPVGGVSAIWSATVPLGTTVRVSNGTGRRLMATRFAAYFAGHGVVVHRVANANSFDHKRSTIFYNPDQREFAVQLASLLPFGARLIEASQGRGQIELIVGFDLLSFDSELGPV